MKSILREVKMARTSLLLTNIIFLVFQCRVQLEAKEPKEGGESSLMHLKHGEKPNGHYSGETRRTRIENQNARRNDLHDFPKRRDFRPRTFGMNRFNGHGDHGRPVKNYDFYDNKDNDFSWFKEQGHNKYPYHEHLPSYSNEGYEEYQKPPDASSVAHAIDTLEKHMSSSEALNSDNMFRNKGSNGEGHMNNNNGGGFHGGNQDEGIRGEHGGHMNDNGGGGFHGGNQDEGTRGEHEGHMNDNGGGEFFGGHNGGGHEDGQGAHSNDNGGSEFFGGDRGGGHHEGNQESHGSNEFHEGHGGEGHGNNEDHHSEGDGQDNDNHGQEKNEHNDNDNHMTGHFGWPKVEGPELLHEDHKEHSESHGNEEESHGNEGQSHGNEGQSHGGEGFWNNGNEGHGQHDKPREGWLPLKSNEHEEHSQHEGQGHNEEHSEHGVEGSQSHEGGHKMFDDHSPPIAQPEMNHHSEDRDVFGGTGAKNEDPHANELGNYGRKIVTGQVPENDQTELHKEQTGAGHQEEYVDFPKANNEQHGNTEGHNRDNMLREPPSFVARQQQQWQQQQVQQQQIQQQPYQQQQQQQPLHDDVKPKNVEGQQTIMMKQEYPHPQERHFDSLPKGPHEGPERGGGLWGDHPGQGEQYYTDPKTPENPRKVEEKIVEKSPEKENSNLKNGKIDVEVGIPTGGPTDNKNITFAIKEVPLKSYSDGLRQGYKDSDIRETARTENNSAGTQQMTQQTRGKEMEANLKPTKRIMKVPVKITTGSFDSRDILSFETNKKFIGGDKNSKGLREDIMKKVESGKSANRWEGTGLKRKLRKYNFTIKGRKFNTDRKNVKGKIHGKLLAQTKDRNRMQNKVEKIRSLKRNLKDKISGRGISFLKKSNFSDDFLEANKKHSSANRTRVGVEGSGTNQEKSSDAGAQKKYVLLDKKKRRNEKKLVARHGTGQDLGAVHGHPAISDEQAMHSSPDDLLEMANGYRHRAEEYESKAKELENHAEVQDHQFDGHGAISQHHPHEGPERGGGLEGHEEGEGEQNHHGEGIGHWSGPTWHGPGPFGSSHFGHGEGGHGGGGHEGGGHEGGGHEGGGHEGGGHEGGGHEGGGHEGGHDEVIHFNTGYPFYHVPRPHHLPDIEYHKPHPPVHGLNPYEVLTSEQFHRPELPAGHGNLPYGANQRTLAPKADIAIAKNSTKKISLEGKEKQDRYDTIMRDFLTDENMETFLLK